MELLSTETKSPCLADFTVVSHTSKMKEETIRYEEKQTKR